MLQIHVAGQGYGVEFYAADSPAIAERHDKG